jgi:Pyruvate/2-oxoacid:ferredoxin oxidoreductase delta subunit
MVVHVFFVVTVPFRWGLLFPTLCWSINTKSMVKTGAMDRMEEYNTKLFFEERFSATICFVYCKRSWIPRTAQTVVDIDMSVCIGDVFLCIICMSL